MFPPPFLHFVSVRVYIAVMCIGMGEFTAAFLLSSHDISG
jgi:hypothetical protein